MARNPLDNVISHWDQLVEGLSASPQELYKSLEEALERREIPMSSIRRVTWNEEGALSARREYLQIRRERHVFDVCAAPFGTGFFFSWWLAERTPLRGMILGPLLFVVIVLLSTVSDDLAWKLEFYRFPVIAPIFFSWIGQLLCFVAGWIFLLGLAAFHARRGSLLLEDAVLFVPLINWLYTRFFRPMTYYRLDTTTMFQSAVHSAVLEIVGGLVEAKGLRGLTPEEQKPVMRWFSGL